MSIGNSVALLASGLLVVACATAGELNTGADAAAGDGDGAAADARPFPPDAPLVVVHDARPERPDALLFDSAPGTPDAAVPPIDAAPLPIDAACTPTVVNLLANPNFDLGQVSWVESSNHGWDIIVDSATLAVAPHSGSYGAWMGGDYDEVATLYQDVAIPAGATNLQVTGYYWIGTEEYLGTAYDVSSVEIRNSGGTLLEQLHQWDNLDENSGWTAFAYSPAGGYAGQTIRLHFAASCDYVDNTNFFYDTIALNATLCL